MKEKQTDVLVVGSGLVGLVAAHCMSSLNYNVIIVDEKIFNKPKKTPIDIRTVAISEGSKQFLDSLFLWDGIKSFAEPIKKIKVYDRSSSNKILFENFEVKKQLGYVVENNKFRTFLISKLKDKKNVKIFFETGVKKIKIEESFVKSYCEKLSIKSKLIIAADGKNSYLRKIMKNNIFKKNYSENALVLNFFHKKNLNNTAYEIFYKTGPLAILPMNSKSKFFQSSIIWSNNKLLTQKLLSCSNEFIANILDEKIGDIIGQIMKINSKQTFPLSAHINQTFVNKRIIYVGDSAHSIHPIAGQGWNLGIKDIKNLEFICKNLSFNKEEIGNEVFCKKYNSMSYKNAFQLYQITDKLNSHFKINDKIYRLLSNAGFGFIENNQQIKNKITKYAMGL